jgi:pimeloyl-ACP methyl ester carboxylesterase
MSARRPVVFLVPGLGLDDRVWSGVRRRLAGEVGVVLLPALGERADRTVDLAVDEQARRLLRQLAGRGDGPVVLVGHSASCPVVVEAANQSSLVVGLVLIGPVTDPRGRTWPRMLWQWMRTAVHERPGEVPVLAPQYRHTGIRTMIRGMDAMRWYQTGCGLRQVHVPVVVVRGGQDRIAGHDWSLSLAEIVGGRLQTADGSAHMVPLTDPEAVVTAVREVIAAAAASSER